MNLLEGSPGVCTGCLSGTRTTAYHLCVAAYRGVIRNTDAPDDGDGERSATEGQPGKLRCRHIYFRVGLIASRL